jgi:hypothetical protein
MQVLGLPKVGADPELDRESVPILVALSIGKDDVRKFLHNGPCCRVHQAYGGSVMGPGKTVDLDKSGRETPQRILLSPILSLYMQAGSRTYKHAAVGKLQSFETYVFRRNLLYMGNHASCAEERSLERRNFEQLPKVHLTGLEFTCPIQRMPSDEKKVLPFVLPVKE